MARGPNILARPHRREIVRTIISLAHNLGLKVTAEGSETESTLAALRETDCEFAQGYSTGRPQTAAELSAVLCALGAGQPAALRAVVTKDQCAS